MSHVKAGGNDFPLMACFSSPSVDCCAWNYIYFLLTGLLCDQAVNLYPALLRSTSPENKSHLNVKTMNITQANPRIYMFASNASRQPKPHGIHLNNPHMHWQSGTGHVLCLANQSRA